jgi:FKBP-type peptidyl-prolyl cis-trans isomerase SlyD
MRKVIGFHYTLTDNAGTVIDTSSGSEPLVFLEQSHQIIPGLEKELISLNLGDKKRIQVPAAEAYGEVNKDLIIKVKRTQFPPEADLQVGDQFQVNEDPHAPVFSIIALENDIVVVDGNHPMAGKDLIFDVEITLTRQATPEEVAHGHAHGPGGHHH